MGDHRDKCCQTGNGGLGREILDLSDVQGKSTLQCLPPLPPHTLAPRRGPLQESGFGFGQRQDQQTPHEVHQALTCERREWACAQDGAHFRVLLRLAIERRPGWALVGLLNGRNVHVGGSGTCVCSTITSTATATASTSSASRCVPSSLHLARVPGIHGVRIDIPPLQRVSMGVHVRTRTDVLTETRNRVGTAVDAVAAESRVRALQTTGGHGG
jgi:hypothetical protein